MRGVRFAPVFVLLLVACVGGGGEQAASDRLKASKDWKLELDDEGVTHEIPVERMDIYLVEDQDYPEIFELYGDGLMLVGEFPIDVHVDYDEAFERLIGRQIEIRSQGGDPRDPKMSKVTIDGVAMPVWSGTLTVERYSGKWSGLDGDRTLYGTIELRIRGIDGERFLRGRFGTLAVTWG